MAGDEELRATSSSQQTERRLSRVQSAAKIGDWEWDLVTDELSWSTEMYRIFGVDEAIYAKTTSSSDDLVHPDEVWMVSRESLKELTDASTAIDKEIHDTIQRLINEHPEVHSAHLVKARRMGPDIMVDVHVVVDPFLSVSEGHQIADDVEKTLIRQVSEVSSVMVHVDTSDDLETESDMSEGAERIVETRTQIRDRLNGIGPLEPPLRGVHEVMPHYTPKGIVAEVFLTAEAGADIERVQASARRLGRRLHEAHKDFANVRLHLFLGEDRGAPT